MNKEQNFISAVVPVDGDPEQVLSFLEKLNRHLSGRFLHYELVLVHTRRPVPEQLRVWAGSAGQPVTLLTMAPGQPQEQCMNAGLDIAIGDYIYEFDTVEMPYEPELIWQAYETVLQGNDIVSVSPREIHSRLFYAAFNAASRGTVRIRTDAFRLVSRRAVNRVHAINENLPYRKAAYAASGLRSAVIEFPEALHSRPEKSFRLAVDSLVLYTDFGYRFSITLTLLMLAASLCELLYTLVTWLTGHPISGWTTTMFTLTTGLTGLFAILTVIVKYLALLLDLVFRKQSYLVENIEKL